MDMREELVSLKAKIAEIEAKLDEDEATDYRHRLYGKDHIVYEDKNYVGMAVTRMGNLFTAVDLTQEDPYDFRKDTEKFYNTILNYMNKLGSEGTI